MNILRSFSNWRSDEIDDFWECPYCKKSYRLDHEQIDFSWYVRGGDEDDLNGILIFVSTYWCPECEKPTINLAEYSEYEFFEYDPTYNGHESLTLQRTIFPTGISIEYPDYIPEPIRNDYEEASLIADLSPKASATLARRCLQGMLLDKWKVDKDNNLFKQIEELKTQIPNKTFDAISAVRRIGNIGAHMKNPNINTIDNAIITSIDAKALVSLLEVLFKSWYVDPHQEEELMDTLISTSGNKHMKEV